MLTFKEKLLAHFQLSAEQFQQLTAPPSLDNLPIYQGFLGIDSITKRIFHAMANQEKIAIYGDYDCDGVMSTSILVATFKKLNYPVLYKLPSRYQDGYGLNLTSVTDFANQGVTLIITVDNGISQHEAISHANSLGIHVIVTDHHELLTDLPPAFGIMHPLLSGYGQVVCCGAYVALMLSRALLGYYDDYLVSLAGIATISDMMPLVSYNREIVRLALVNINREKYINILKLAEVNEITEVVIGMKIAPKINAIGRMTMEKELNVLVEYMTTTDIRRINDIYAWIYQINESRKTTMKEAVLNTDEVNLAEPAIVMITNENEGMLGLLAARFVNTYAKPSIVFTKENNDDTLLKGSARSRRGFHVAKAFSDLSDLMVRFGGHELAGGCTIKLADFPEFKKRFNQLASQYIFEEQVEKVIDLDTNELTMSNYQIYRSLAPYGQGFEIPLFRLSHFPTNQLTFSRDDKHIITTLFQGIKLVGFHIDKSEVMKNASINLIGTLNLSEYKSYRDLNFAIQKFD